MELIIDDLKYTMPPLDAPVPKDPLLRARFFDSYFCEAWYPVKFDGKDTFWGLIDDAERTFGYFRLRDLECPSSDPSLPDIERDMRFAPCRAGELPPRNERRPLYESGAVCVGLVRRQDGGLDIMLIESGWSSVRSGFVRFPTEVIDELRIQLDLASQALANEPTTPKPVEVTWSFSAEDGRPTVHSGPTSHPYFF